MKRDDRYPTAWFQQLWGLLQHFLQCSQLIIHLNAQSLENLGEILIRISPFPESGAKAIGRRQRTVCADR